MEEPPVIPSERDARSADFSFAAFALGALVLVALLYLAFPHVMALVLIALLLSYALLPLVDAFDPRVPRWASVLIIGLGGAGLVALAVTLLTPVVVRELEGIGAALEQLEAELGQIYREVKGRLPGWFVAWVDRLGGSVTGQLSSATLVDWAKGAGTGLAAVASGIVFVPIFVFMMLRGYHRVIRSIGELVPIHWRPRFQQRAAQLDQVLSGFVRGQLLVALVVACLYVGAFTLIGIPLAVLLGIIAGLGELVPYLGGAIALVLGSLMALAGGSPLDVLWVVVAFAAIQALEGGVLSPWIVGRRARLGPVTVIVALAVGGQLFSLLGLLLAVPVAAVLKVAAGAAIEGYRHTRFFRREAQA